MKTSLSLEAANSSLARIEQNLEQYNSAGKPASDETMLLTIGGLLALVMVCCVIIWGLSRKGKKK